ncbi:MAG: TetR/AcrR family transcriptional regulator [Chloroflexi bacterium]|nr:TetR/AcrR family transcriptional regulator [Chloroflexota bacterium]
MSPRRADPETRKKLLEAGTNLSLERGFADMTVEEVCNTAGLTKGAFFHYFRSKESLGKALLEGWITNGAAAFDAASFWEIDDPLERVYGYIDFTIELTKVGPCGCMVGIYSQELWQSHPELRIDCEDAFTGWAEGFAGLLQEAKALYATRAAFDARSLAYHFVAVFEGGMILARAFKRTEIAVEQLEHFKRYVHCLFEAESNRNGSN